MTRPELYLSGPMTGHVDFNRAAFRGAADALEAAGYIVHTPLETTALAADGTLRPYGDLLRDDLMLMLTCDAVATLPGWTDSKGASIEVGVADAIGMPVQLAVAWLEPSGLSVTAPPRTSAGIIRLVAQLDTDGNRAGLLEALGIALSLGDDESELNTWRRLRALLEPDDYSEVERG